MKNHLTCGRAVMGGKHVDVRIASFSEANKLKAKFLHLFYHFSPHNETNKWIQCLTRHFCNLYLLRFRNSGIVKAPQTNPEKSESAALSLRLGLPSTPIPKSCPPKRRFSNTRNFKKRSSRLIVNGKHLKIELFENVDVTIVILLTLTLVDALKRFCRQWLL